LFSDVKNRFYIADNLRKMFPTAKIIICIRDPDEWLLSAYKQYTMAYFGYTFQEYFKKFDKQGLDFNSYIFYLRKLFGEENVLLLTYKDFKADPKAYVEAICWFMGVETPVFENKRVYESLSDGQIAFIVLFDKIFKSKALHLLLSLAIRFVRNDPTIMKWRKKKL